MGETVDVAAIGRLYREVTQQDIASLGFRYKLVGFLASENAPSLTYAEYAKSAAEAVGIDFELRCVPRLELEKAISEANATNSIHGIMVYYPIFGPEQDNYIKDLVDPKKDVEGLNVYWAKKLYANDRMIDGDPIRRSLLPCTPLAVVKILDSILPYPKGVENPLAGKRATVFNRSEVVGRPLAAMLANDGASVVSFDIDGPLHFVSGRIEEIEITRAEALAASDIVVGGVPTKQFEKIRGEEIRDDAVCVNFASVQNFEDCAKNKCRAFAPRVGPVTISMLLRNAVRLYRNFHQGTAHG